MKLRECAFLADEIIDPEVVARLKEWGFDVVSASEMKLEGNPDSDILSRAYREGRVILTHDRDFGKLAIGSRRPFFGVVYIRLGHMSSEKTLEILEVVFESAMDVTSPFMVVGQRIPEGIQVRTRSKL